MEKSYKFSIGNSVIVTSYCNSYGEIGEIIKAFKAHSYSYYTVHLNNGQIHNYNELSLRLTDNRKDSDSMSKSNIFTGDYSIALVEILDYESTKRYGFACFDENIKVDDYVICDSNCKYKVGVVKEIVPKHEYNGELVTKEIVCKCDFSDFEHRKEVRKQKEEIKRKMDEIVANTQEIALYKIIAEQHPELKELLESYINLK